MQFYTKQDVEKFDDIPLLFIQTSLEDHIFRITLNRPEKRNAFTPTMAAEITFSLAYAHHHPHVRCVILDAKGPVFCAGADLNAFHDAIADTVNHNLPVPNQEIRLGDAFAQLLKPSIAVVEGPVLAGGFLLICGCNFVLSVPEATFSLPEVKRGIWPMQVMASLMPIIPSRKILEMAITGRSYNANEALGMGLITSIIDLEKISWEAKVLAKTICNNAPYAIQSGMEACQNLSNIPKIEHHSYLKSQLDKLLESEDAQEGALAFKQKRNPVWKGR
ncbi:enoyl-CoA hydratase-related protein [Dyadobacter psychrotolerans]|uniref:Enoyl-CoA hydratase n=1 Tax=Dyadobacter psychrotolerans TaxID=2541721 RepID=A0A4V2Z3D3_9BACT|nr:enoyl-CoA hydratase-related protein [Dyadobacter psychrotolerans]TDE11928.1 enoyl-CoA hydratase [Dyadobacter psychrotolerans]